MHPGRPEGIRNYDICTSCNDDFDVWFRSTTPQKYIEYHNSQRLYMRKMFELKKTDKNYLDRTKELFGWIRENEEFVLEYKE